MSGDRIDWLEREVSLIKEMQSPLIEKMAENTTAVTLLTHQVKDLVDVTKENRADHEDLMGRVTVLETDKAIRDSSKGWKDHATKVVIGLSIGGIGSLFLFVLSGYFEGGA